MIKLRKSIKVTDFQKFAVSVPLSDICQWLIDAFQVNIIIMLSN